MASPEDHGQDQNMGWTSTGKAMASVTASSSSPSTTLSSFFDDGDSSDRPKTILIFVFAIAALLLIIGALIWRYHYIRQHNLPMRSFFQSTTHLKDRPPLPVHLSYPRSRSRTLSRLDSLTLTTLPVPPLAHPRSRRTSNTARNSAVRGRTRTRGADIDVGGRRLPADGISEKDILPAYGEEAAGGRLPLYVELEAVDFGRGVGGGGNGIGTPQGVAPVSGEGFTPVERQNETQSTSQTEHPR